jgi:hypothetical protein
MTMFAVYPDPVGGNPHHPKQNSPPEIYVARLPSSSDDDVIEADPVDDSSMPSPGIYPDAVFVDGDPSRLTGASSIRRYRVVAGGGQVPPPDDPLDEEAVNMREALPENLMYRHFIFGLFEDIFGGLHLRCYVSRRARRVVALCTALGFVLLTGKVSEVAELVLKLFF